MKTLSATALTLGVWVPEDELGPDVVLHIVHFCADEHH